MCVFITYYFCSKLKLATSFSSYLLNRLSNSVSLLGEFQYTKTPRINNTIIINVTNFIPVRKLTISFKDFRHLELFNNKIEAMSYIDLNYISISISLRPTEIIMRDETRTIVNPLSGKSVDKFNFNIFINLHPTDGTHWVLVLRGEDDKIHYFDNYGVETEAKILRKCVRLGSKEDLHLYDESFLVQLFIFILFN